MSDASQTPPAIPVPASATAESPRNPLAVVALVFGFAAIAVSLISQGVLIALVRTGDFGIYSLVSAVVAALALLVGAAAIVIGLVAAQRPGGRLLAGIGVGLGIGEVVAILGSFVVNTFAGGF